MNQPDRIYFLDNPYPNGHKIKEFSWRGKIEEDESMWFDFHLKSDDYYAEDETDEDEDEESQNDWDSKIVWSNYNQCIMSSTYWGDPGIRIHNSAEKISFYDLIKEPLLADTLPLNDDFDYDDFAFGIYLLGHDSCANHKIKITSTSNNKFTIEWTGKIALTYAGESEFKYDFSLLLQNTEFDGFYYPKSWSLERATEFFKSNFEDFEDYHFIDLNPKSNKREYKFGRK